MLCDFWFLIMRAALPALSASPGPPTMSWLWLLKFRVLLSSNNWNDSAAQKERKWIQPILNNIFTFYCPRLGSHNSGLPIFSFGNSCLRARPSRVSLWGAGTVKQSDVNTMVNLYRISGYSIGDSVNTEVLPGTSIVFFLKKCLSFMFSGLPGLPHGEISAKHC